MLSSKLAIKNNKHDLKPKEAIFVDHYLLNANGFEAARAAKYKAPDAAAKRLLEKPNVRMAIQEKMDLRSIKTGITAEYVLDVIRETIDRCRQAVPVMIYDKESKELKASGEYKFEYQGVLKGAELLGKHLKLFNDKLEVEHKMSFEDYVLEAERSRVVQPPSLPKGNLTIENHSTKLDDIPNNNDDNKQDIVLNKIDVI